jgi:hypothetical protein
MASRALVVKFISTCWICVRSAFRVQSDGCNSVTMSTDEPASRWSSPIVADDVVEADH